MATLHGGGAGDGRALPLQVSLAASKAAAAAQTALLLHAGWAVRRKSNHFAAYDDVAKKFAKVIDVDPWMINP